MRHLTLIAALLALAALAAAQAPVAEWSFDEDVTGWDVTDPASQITSTDDANVIREEDNGVLEFSFTPDKATMSAIVCGVPAGLTAARSIQFFAKTTDQTMVMVALVEADGSNYSTGFTSLVDRWQEVSFNLSGFTLGEDSTDENGQLDPEQVSAIMIGDVVTMLALLADQIPFIIAPDMSPRMLWIDDFWVDVQGVDPRWQAFDADGEKGVRVDSFESAPLQWMVMAGAGIEVAYDDELKAEGEFSMRVSYDLPPNKALAMLTSLGGVPRADMTGLRLSLLSETETTLLIEIEERDESKYQTMVPLPTGDEFDTVELALAEFTLSEDSEDENGQLDITQAKQILIADISVLTGAPVALNTIWLDDLVLFE